MSERYDLVVIGSGPAGQKGAIAAAKLGKRVAIIDRQATVGGVCLHTGTIPSKTLREAILYLSGFRMRSFYGPRLRGQAADHASRTSPSAWTRWSRDELEVVRDQLRRNGVELLDGLARFVDPHALEVEREDGRRGASRRTTSSSPAARGPRGPRTSRSTALGIRDVGPAPGETTEGVLPRDRSSSSARA